MKYQIKRSKSNSIKTIEIHLKSQQSTTALKMITNILCTYIFGSSTTEVIGIIVQTYQRMLAHLITIFEGAVNALPQQLKKKSLMEAFGMVGDVQSVQVIVINIY